AGQPPARVAALVLKRSGGLTSLPFRLESIPLPDFQVLPPVAPRGSVASTGRGGTIVTQVLVNGRAAGVGTLYVGFRPLREASAPETNLPGYPAAYAGWQWEEART